MIEHTYNLDRYVRYYPHCVVQFMERPKPTKRKERYREPKVVKTKRFRSQIAAVMAANQWIGKLV